MEDFHIDSRMNNMIYHQKLNIKFMHIRMFSIASAEPTHAVTTEGT